MPKITSITFAHPPVDDPACGGVAAAGVPFRMPGSGE
jgi:hypothetical protein